MTDEQVEKLHPFLVWCLAKVVRKILENTIHVAKLENRLPMRQHIKSRFPQLNHRRLQETYATDTMFASVKSFEGYNAAQVFSGRKSGMKKVCGLRTESWAHQALENFIRDVGAPYLIHSDNAKAELVACGLTS